MALKECKECRREVSSEAEKCPNCGAPIKTKSSFGCLSAFGLILLIGFLGSQFGEKSVTTKDWKTKADNTAAYVMVQETVRGQLKSPSTAKFPVDYKNPEVSVIHYGNQRYSVKSYVDSQNSFGATIRTRFSGEVEQIAEDKWRLISFDIR